MTSLESSTAQSDATSIEPSTQTHGSVFILFDWPRIESTGRPGHYRFVSEVGGQASAIYTVAHAFKLDAEEGQSRVAASLMIPSQGPAAGSPYLYSSKFPLTPVRLALSNTSTLKIFREGGEAEMEICGEFWLQLIGVDPANIRAQAKTIEPTYLESVDQQLSSLHKALISLSGKKVPVQMVLTSSSQPLASAGAPVWKDLIAEVTGMMLA